VLGGSELGECISLALAILKSGIHAVAVNEIINRHYTPSSSPSISSSSSSSSIIPVE